MTKINTQNKEKIIQDYATYLLDSSDLNTIWEFARDGIVNNLKNYDIESLESEISEFCPHILEK